jgi:hypothetical protein
VRGVHTVRPGQIVKISKIWSEIRMPKDGILEGGEGAE